MKKKFSKVMSALMLALLIPLGFILSACGATSTNEVRGVHFVSSTYDEATGKAIFEVDKDIPTRLNYKVNPSTWSGYSVTYLTDDTTSNMTKYRLENGVINVNDNSFQPIEVRIMINNFSDTCIVRLKEYPVRVFAQQSDVYVNSLGVYSITPMGEFENSDGTTTTRPLLDYEYNFKVVSSDPSVISVPNASRLKVCSIRKNSSSSTVTVTLNNTIGQSKNMSFTINVNVVQNAKNGFLLIDGYDKFVNDGDKINIKLADLEQENGQYLINFEFYVFSEYGKFTKTNSILTTNYARYISVNNEDGQIMLNNNSLITDVQINVWTPLTDATGNAFAVSFSVNFV